MPACPGGGVASSPGSMKCFGSFFLLLAVALLANCSSVDTRRTWLAKADLGQFRHIYVESASNDSAQLDVLLAAELKRLGYDAASGVRTMRPLNTELVISYDSRWEWDFRQYLIEISVTVRNARSEQMVASGREFHPGVTNKTPEAMVRDVLAPLFAPVTPSR